MKDRYILQADGTRYDEGECGYSDGSLWCFLPSNTDQVSAFADFSDKNKTKHILFHYGIMDDEYDDFTEIILIKKNLDDKVYVELVKG